MNNEIYIVAAYTPDVEREELLRHLVNQLHKENKEILLISHSVTPIDIVKKCKHSIYDQENKLLYDDVYKHLAWNRSLPNSTIRSRDTLKSSTTLLAVYRLFLFGLGYSKMVGYKYAHYIEYDCNVDDFKIFDINREILKEYSCVTYTNGHGHPIGFYMAFNLDDYTFDDLKYDEEKFKKKYTEDYPLLYFVEELTRIFFMETKNTFYKRDIHIKQEGLTGALYSSNKSFTSWVVPIVENENLHLFISESDNKKIVVEYIINNSYNKLEIFPNVYWYYPICNWVDSKYLKILIDNKLHLEYDLTNQSVRDKLITNNYIERKPYIEYEKNVNT